MFKKGFKFSSEFISESLKPIFILKMIFISNVEIELNYFCNLKYDNARY